jgi:hypothetical protein
VGSRSFVSASRGSAPRKSAKGVCGHTPGPRRQRVTPEGFKQTKLPGPHWGRRFPKPLRFRIASLSLALLAQGLLASLLLNFNSAALHGNSDGMSNQKLDTGCKAETSDFFEKIGCLGRSQLENLTPHPLFSLLPYSLTPLFPFPSKLATAKYHQN